MQPKSQFVLFSHCSSNLTNMQLSLFCRPAYLCWRPFPLMCVSAAHIIICSGDPCKRTSCWVVQATSPPSKNGKGELVATLNLNANRSCTSWNGGSLSQEEVKVACEGRTARMLVIRWHPERMFRFLHLCSWHCSNHLFVCLSTNVIQTDNIGNF